MPELHSILPKLVSNFVSASLLGAAPLIITAMAGVVAQRSGVLNIALEGLMGVGAFTAAAVQVLSEQNLGQAHTGLALTAAALAGMAAALPLAWACARRGADPVLVGIGLNLAYLGLPLYLSTLIFGAERSPPFRSGMLRDGLGMYPSIYLAGAAVASMSFFLTRTPGGLRLRACGQDAEAARAAGLKPEGLRSLALLCSGALAGLGGASLVLSQTVQYSMNTINGAGFLALAAAVMGSYRPLGSALAALAFGAASALSVLLPNLWTAMPTELYKALPWALTLVVLALGRLPRVTKLWDGRRQTEPGPRHPRLR